MGGGGESAEAAFRAIKSYLIGHDPARLEEMRFRIANPTASLYNNRTQILAALEFACLDILGQAWGVPVCDILGGRLRDRVPFAAYCFFRYANPQTGVGEVRTIEQVIEHACTLTRPGRRFSRGFLAIRSERRLVHGTSHSFRSKHRGLAQ
jgi:glucarate dehydratase